ncbi:MAG: biopolymer transporter ExbD [Campylobacterales bacterium]|nr:biopolymer transporter ExbD [Campylobacterales bacterium]
MTKKRFDAINVVPFIDIMLVLLVIVLTTASFVAHGFIPVDLSQSKNSSKLTQEDIITISIKSDGNLYYNKQISDLNQIASKLLVMKKESPININCDKNVKFEIFVDVLDLLKKENFTNLNIVTKR